VKVRRSHPEKRLRWIYLRMGSRKTSPSTKKRPVVPVKVPVTKKHTRAAQAKAPLLTLLA
jgi:hypothetical protein